jgi:PAS domain S-box-containing protein
MKAEKEKHIDEHSGKFSRVALYIVLSGWIGLFIYIFTILDTQENVRLIEHFLSTEREGIRFRALLLFAPFILTVLGFLVSEREKLLRRAILSRNKLELMNKEILEYNERLVAEIFDREWAAREIHKYKLTHDTLEKAPFGVYVVNTRGNIDYVNQFMLTIIGSTYEQFLNTNVFQLPFYIKIGLPEKIRSVFKGNFFEMGPIKHELHPGGNNIVWNFTGVPFVEEGEKKALIFVEDITERNDLPPVIVTLLEKEMKHKGADMSLGLGIYNPESYVA